jgi:hypothetical protein
MEKLTTKDRSAFSAGRGKFEGSQLPHFLWSCRQ